MTMNSLEVSGRGGTGERGEHGTGPASELEELQEASCLFSWLGEVSRLAILQHLLLGEHRVVDLTRHLGLAQSTVSRHLALLRDCGLVTSTPQGRATVWSLVDPDGVMRLMAAAEQLMQRSNHHAALLCPEHGPERGARTTRER